MKSFPQRTALTAISLLIFGVFFAATLTRGPEAATQSSQSKLQWFKGNTHTHTTMSDGDSSPEVVIQWYVDNGYNFLVLSDHNVLTDTEKYSKFNSKTFILIPGEEVTDHFEKSPIHINGLNINEVIKPQGGKNPVEVIQNNVDAIRKQSGVPHLNHPNFHWVLNAEIISKVEHDRLFEVYNGHPSVNNNGNKTNPSLDEMWDQILSTGKCLYGIAVDDAHHFSPKKWGPQYSNPGRGWVMVRAKKFDAKELLTALENGDFYATTGVILEEVETGPQGFVIGIKTESKKEYVTKFIGPGGKVLKETRDNPAKFDIPKDILYVRAKVIDSDDKAAWIQPVFPNGEKRPNKKE